MAYAGMDIGTSGCKLLVYDLDGNKLFKAGRKYSETGDNGYRELDGAMVLKNALSVLKEGGEKCPEKIEAISVACLGESVVCLDEEDQVLYPSMLTGDSRGIPETEELIERFGGERIFDITGLPPNELYGLPKCIWLNRNTDVIQKAEKILFFEDYITYTLTGERQCSYSAAARSLAFDINEKAWSDELLAQAGIRKEQMSKPVEPCTVIGTILPEMAEKLCLPGDMKVVVGGHDQTCAAVGSGLIDDRHGECGMGTCEFMFMMLPGPVKDPRMIDNDFTCIPYVLPDQYLTSLEVTTCGILKNWARESILKGIENECIASGKEFFPWLDSIAGKRTTEVLLLPQFGSLGNPDLSMDARGTITGLTIHTRPEEIYRAVLEGLAFQMYLSYDRVKELGVHMEEIVATGGGAASDLTLQIRADVFRMKVRTLQDDEAGALGCMIMAAAGAGAYEDIQEGIERAVKTKKEFIPNPEMFDYYEKKFEKYKKLYALMYDFK